MLKKSLLIIIPAYNEAKMIGKVIDSIPNKIRNIAKRDILVIDDGSRDHTVLIAHSKKVKVIRHIINRGLGAVLATGFEYARRFSYTFIITFDADGQHNPHDIFPVLKPLIDQKADVVIGSRLLYPKTMPLARRLINFISNFITLLLFNVWTTDSQSGLRGFNLKALQKINIRTQRMEVSSEIFKEISRTKLKLAEVPIHSIYTKYSLHKGQRISNAPNVVWKLLLSRFT